MGSPRGVYGLLPDEILSDRVREHLSDFGLWGGHVDVTTVDGIVYLRGREESEARVDAIERTVRQLGGVVDVVAEMKVADLTRDRH
jgi:osmotically-inducible protein OsmY